MTAHIVFFPALADLAGFKLGGAVNPLDAAYDQWWRSVQFQLVNEDALGPPENPFKVLYKKQSGSGERTCPAATVVQSRGTLCKVCRIKITPLT